MLLISVSFYLFVHWLPKITANQVQLITAAEEVGAKEKSPYNSYTYSGINSSSLSDIMRYFHCIFYILPFSCSYYDN